MRVETTNSLAMAGDWFVSVVVGAGYVLRLIHRRSLAARSLHSRWDGLTAVNDGCNASSIGMRVQNASVRAPDSPQVSCFETNDKLQRRVFRVFKFLSDASRYLHSHRTGFFFFLFNRQFDVPYLMRVGASLRLSR